MLVTRRQAIMLGLALPLVPLAGGCRATMPSGSTASGQDAIPLLRLSAMAHGLGAYSALEDVNVRYAGHWRRLVGVLQPTLVDSGFRGGSEERLLLREGVMAQSHTGPKGHKQVVRVSSAKSNGIQVWFNGEQAHDKDSLDAAALVADAYALFLFGPMLLIKNENPHRDLQAASAGSAEVTQDGHTYSCDVITLQLSPGFGNAESDQVALYIDRETHLMRRVRMTLNGLESTRGALVDIDTSDHRALHGIMWPTSFHERLLRPAPLDVHRWRLTGLDVNRGETWADLGGPEFLGKAAAPATPLPAGSTETTTRTPAATTLQK